MAAILQQLSGNPLATTIGQKIEAATDGREDDWALIMEICDEINDTDEGPRDAVRAIKKRFQQNAGKNHVVVMRTLTILETCVKNCGRRFHTLVTSKDFVQDLVKLIGPKNDPPAQLQEKVLSLIQTWADAFRNQPDLSGAYQIYVELKNKGIEFPAQDLDSMVPIYTPSRSVTSGPTHHQPQHHPLPPVQNQATHHSPHPPVTSTSAAHHPVSSMISSVPVRLNPDQMTKLQSELEVVQGNIRVFDEMMSEMSPGKDHHPDDWELLRELNTTCRSMQKRMVQLIEKVANEEFTVELLRLNDELNNLFVRYDRFVKKKSSSSSGPESDHLHQLPPPQFDRSKKPASTNPNDDSLIDLADLDLGMGSSASGAAASSSQVSSGLSSQMAGAKISGSSGSRGRPESMGDDGFDMFAQSRSTTYEKSKTTGSSYADNTNVDIIDATLGSLSQNRAQRSKEPTVPLPTVDREEELDEMEKWLREQEKAETVTVDSSDFDRFLEERAMAAEGLPLATSSTPANRSSSNTATSSNSNHPKPDPFGL